MGHSIKLSILFIIYFNLNSSFAGPYESSVFYSANSAGLVGANSSYIKSSEAVFFNPAGLAPPSKKLKKVFGKSDFTGNFSSHSHSQEVPYLEDKTISSQSMKISPYSVSLRIGSKKFKWTLGLGYHKPILVNKKYDELDYSSINPLLTAVGTESFQLDVSEMTAGIGYSLLNWLDIGIAWRYGNFKAQKDEVKIIELASSTVGQIVGVSNGVQFMHQMNFSELVGSNNTGYLFGIQIGPPKNSLWGIALSYRTKMIIRLTGNYSGTISNTGINDTNSVLALIGHQPDVSKKTDSIDQTDYFWESAYPSKMSFSAHLAYQSIGIFFDYTKTNYSEVQEIISSGEYYLPASVVGTTISTQKKDFLSYITNWKDEQTIRIAGHYMLNKTIILQAGYYMSSQVVQSENASMTDPPPFPETGMALGLGFTHKRWQLNLAYSITNIKAETYLEDKNIYRPLTISSTFSSINYPYGTWDYKITKFLLGISYTIF